MRSLASVAVLALTSCIRLGGGREAVNTTETTAAAFGFVPRDDVVEQIAGERCRHEEACRNIGPDGDYPSTAACQRELGEIAKNALQPSSCARGSVVSDLESCLKSVRNERCTNATDAQDREARCGSQNLCR